MRRQSVVALSTWLTETIAYYRGKEGLIDVIFSLFAGVYNTVNIVEIKSEGEYFITSINGWYFWRIMDEHGARVHYAGSSVLL